MTGHIELIAAPRGLRVWARIGVVVLAALALGCYEYRPLHTAPEPGVRLAFDLNDRGRLAVADSMGPEIARVEGVLDAQRDSSYVVRVAEVTGLRGRRSKWSGEAVTLRPEFVSGLSERRLSKWRTGLLAGGVTAGLVAFIASRNLFGISGPDTDGPIGDGGTNTLRRRGVGLSFGLRVP